MGLGEKSGPLRRLVHGLPQQPPNLRALCPAYPLTPFHGHSLQVLHADIMLGADGRSKGCGLVSFANAHDAARAISTLHDSVLHSRSIFVREDREPVASPSGAKTGGKGFGSANTSNGCQVFVGNLPWDVAWQALKDHFRAAGNVVHADVMMDVDGRSRGFGTVLFSTTREAAKAIQLFNESFLLGRQIEVRPDQHSHR